jgi:hypothetical protein
VDGPEFDGHEVEWDEVLARRASYEAEEVASLRRSGATSHF